MAPNELLEILFLIGLVVGVVIYATRFQYHEHNPEDPPNERCRLHKWKSQSRDGKNFLICDKCLMIPSLLTLEEDED